MQKLQSGKSRIISAENICLGWTRLCMEEVSWILIMILQSQGKIVIYLQYTGKDCDLSPYHDNYEASKGIQIVNAATCL